MKNLINLETVFRIWAGALMTLVVAGILYSVWSLATGNYHATASFEF